MLHILFLLGIAIVALALIAVSFICDWVRLSTISRFAQENCLGTIPMNLFKSADAVRQIKASYLQDKHAIESEFWRQLRFVLGSYL